MKTFFYATRSNGDYIYDTFPSDLIYLVSDFERNKNLKSITINKEVHEAKLGRKKNDYGQLFILTTEKKFIHREKFFRELLDNSLNALRPLSEFQNKLIENQNSTYQEFIHNVVSLNTYSIQNIFALLPQHRLNQIENVNKQAEEIKKIIHEKPYETVKTLQKQLKYILAMKVEFSVFERTQKLYSSPTKMESSAREVVLSVLQIFSEDFDEQKITVYLDASEIALQKRIYIDIDSLFVSLYYLLDNAIKYCCPKTDFRIKFKEESSCFSIVFSMVSIRIEESEKNQLCIRGYRSNSARQLNSKGSGLGMYRIQKTLSYNNAELEISPRVKDFNKVIGNIQYEVNAFKIKFLGQQNWFKVTS